MDAGRRSKHGAMTPARAAALEGVPGWAWAADLESVWQEKLAALRAYVGAHAALPPDGHPSGLGKWVTRQRQAKKAIDAGRKSSNKMTLERVAALEGVPGWAWAADMEARWQERLGELKAHVAAHGALPPRGHPSGLGEWVDHQRQAKKAMDAGRTGTTKMTPQRAAALEAVPGWAWAAYQKRAREQS